MKKLKLQEKLAILKANVSDLRNASIEDIEDIFSEGDVLSSENKLFLIKKDTVCRLVKELLEEKLAEDTAMLEEGQSNDKKIELLNLRTEIEVLEEQLYRMSLAKAVIVPTDDLYRTKAEYDTLREFNAQLTKSLREAERKLSILSERNNILIKKVIDLEMQLERNEVLSPCIR